MFHHKGAPGLVARGPDTRRKAPQAAAKSNSAKTTARAAESGYDAAAKKARSGLSSGTLDFIDRFERKLLSAAPEDAEAFKFSLRNARQHLGLPEDVHAQLLGEVEAMERRQPVMVPYWKGRRVQASPATDAWMMGDTYGDVTQVVDDIVSVKMDRSGRVRRFRRDYVLPA